MELWQLWLLATLDGWNDAVSGLSFMFFVGSVVVFFAGGVFGCAHLSLSTDINDDAKKIRRLCWFRITPMAVGLGVFFLLVGAAIPSSRSAWTMVGGYVATNVEGIEQLPPNLVKAANQFLEQYTTESELE